MSSEFKCEIQPVLKPSQVAEKFQVTEQTVKNWCREGKIDAFKLPSGEWRIKLTTCEKIMNGGEGS